MIIRECTECGKYRPFRNKVEGLCKDCTDDVTLEVGTGLVKNWYETEDLKNFANSIEECSFIRRANKGQQADADIFIDAFKMYDDDEVKGTYLDLNSINTGRSLLIEAEEIKVEAVPFLLWLAHENNVMNYENSVYYKNINPTKHIR